MDTTTLLTYETAKFLLHPSKQSVFTSAESKRSWSRKWMPALRDLDSDSVLDRLWDTVLMRSYDGASGSQPDSQYRLLARDARMRLDTEETRRETLTTHIDHGIWRPTPYISFTDSQKSLRELAEFREMRDRGNQEIMVIDPRVRFERGLPVLHCSEEMAHYGVKSPYRDGYWIDHYLCLWEVTPEEVVGIWSWDSLRNESKWLETIVMPAVEQRRESRDRRKTENKEHKHERAPFSLHQTCNSLSYANPSEGDDVPEDMEQLDSGAHHDESDSVCWSGSEDGYEKVCDENGSRELIKMYKDLKID